MRNVRHDVLLTCVVPRGKTNRVPVSILPNTSCEVGRFSCPDPSSVPCNERKGGELMGVGGIKRRLGLRITTAACARWVALPKLPRAQIRVKTVVVGIALLALCLSHFIGGVRRQHEAVVVIRGAGGTVWYDWQWRDGKPYPSGKPRWAARFMKPEGDDYFSGVVKVSVGTIASGSLLERVAQFRGLEELSAAGSPAVTDVGLAEIASLKGLRSLSIHSMPITDAGLIHLRGLVRLRQLYIDSTRVTDRGLANLAALVELEQLGLRNLSGVTDDGLCQIGALKNLKILLLGGTEVSDAGLDRLDGLTKLQIIDVSDSKVSRLGASRFRARHPGTIVLQYNHHGSG
jgi:hypothetical protein